jgi:hypothetical protein
VRASTVLNRPLDLRGAAVRGVSLPSPGLLIIDVALRQRRLVCPYCG